ncbi:MAG: bifunctional hydroxymethylpyrimidine kinase/phosphomethylpyrimidine kinase [Rhodospirillales bacterium]
MRGRVLVIAGSDSGGGAGIQADIKTITALGGFAATAITALTAQNTEDVFGIFDVPAAFVVQQIEVVLDDIGADCIKIGMLHRCEIIEAVADVLTRRATGIPVVLDPVMVAKGGQPLLAADAVDVLRRTLVPLADVLTPNLPEAAVLVDGGQDPAPVLAARLQALGAAAVLLKGGHGTGPILQDILVRADAAPEVFESPRIDSRHTHGTGCTLASAIACGLAQGLDVRDAVICARAFVRAAMLSAPGYGRGHGPLNHAHTVAEDFRG